MIFNLKTYRYYNHLISYELHAKLHNTKKKKKKRFLEIEVKNIIYSYQPIKKHREENTGEIFLYK